jgi:hypothetical protein
LAILRNTDDIEEELQELNSEAKGNVNNDEVSIIGLFKSPESRLAILIAMTLHIVQQLSGINAVSIKYGHFLGHFGCGL